MNDIFLSEISFKDKESDWIEISVNSPIDTPITIKADKTIAQITNIPANTHYILIHFKAEKEKTVQENGILHIYTTASGLTGTTEQVTLHSPPDSASSSAEPQILDAACWQNSSPTESEIADMQELQQIFPTTCLNSEDISSNQSIAKTASGWEIFKHPTPGENNIHTNSAPTAKITIQKGSLISEVPFSLNLDGSDSSDPDKDELAYKWTFPDQIIEKENPASYKFEISGTYEISLTVTDPQGLSSTDTLTIRAQNSAEDLKSAELLEQIVSPQAPQPPYASAHRAPEPQNPFWLPLLLGLAIIGATILKITSHSRR